MDQAILYAEYERLLAANDLAGLVSLLPSISDLHPQAAHMLNCIGHALGVTALSLSDLTASIHILERALALAHDPVVRAKVLVNLAAFHTWRQAPDALHLGQAALAVPLPPAQAHLHGLALYYVAVARACAGEFDAAKVEFEHVLSYPLIAGQKHSVHVALASLAARAGDAVGVEAHLRHVTSAEFKPYVDGVRARLALTSGDLEVACLLARDSIIGFAANPVQLSTIPPMFSVRALYAEALAARGDTAESARVQYVLTTLNGGSHYTALWGGL